MSTSVYKELLAGLRILDPTHLATDQDIATALNVLEGTLDIETIYPIILASLQPECLYVFEFILSCKSLFLPMLNPLVDTCHSHQ
jgi:hypothetical protein